MDMYGYYDRRLGSDIGFPIGANWRTASVAIGISILGTQQPWHNVAGRAK